MAKEATEASEWASYNCGMQETELRLAEELAEVCRDYCKEVWAEALNRVGVPATFEWRLAENIFHLEDIRKVPMVLPPPAVLAFPPSEQPSTTQASLLPPEVFEGSSKASNQSQEVEMAEGKEAGQGGPQPEDKGKGKEVKALPEAKGKKVAFKIKDVDSKAKDAAAKAKDADPKDDLPLTKAYFQDFSFLFCTFFFFLLWQFATVYNVSPFPCLMKRYQLWLHESLFSLQCLYMVGVIIILPSDET